MTDPKEERTQQSGPTINIDLGLGGMFKGIGNLLDLLSEMSERGEPVSRTGEIKFGGSDALRGVYGFSVRTGLGGIPHVESFGNIRETEEGPIVVETREPLIDVFDEGETILVVAELPGVADEEITLDVQGDVLALSTQGARKYAKEILLPAPVSTEGMVRTYNNGILEVRLRKTQ